MNKLVKKGMLDSIKGHYGGFCLNDKTLQVTLADLGEITGDHRQFDLCVLHLNECSETKPCPLHNRVAGIRDKWQQILERTRIGDLLDKDHSDFLKSITVN
jgi:DNA-binding IscR family transcriptional regulator